MIRNIGMILLGIILIIGCSKKENQSDSVNDNSSSSGKKNQDEIKDKRK